MRIALASREFVPFWGGGIGTYALNAARAWAGAGHDIHILTQPFPGLQARGPAICPGVTFHSVQPVGRRAEADYIQHSRGLRELLRRLHSERALDAVEFPDYWAEGWESLRDRRGLEGATLAIRLHSPTRLCRDLNDEGRGDAYIQDLVKREHEAIAAADTLISPTRSLLDWVQRNVPGAKDCAHGIVPYPFDRSNIEDLGSLSMGPASRETPEVLYFGRFERRKGVHLFVKAAVGLLETGLVARFRLMGGDTNTAPGNTPMRAWLEAQVPERWRNAILFEAARPRADLGAAIRQADACVFPSLWENFPNALLEAMSLGACCIGSGGCGIGEIIEHEKSGLLFRAGDADDLATAIRRVLADPELREHVGASAPRRIESLCAPAIVIAQMIAALGATPARPTRPGAAQPDRRKFFLSLARRAIGGRE